MIIWQRTHSASCLSAESEAGVVAFQASGDELVAPPLSSAACLPAELGGRAWSSRLMTCLPAGWQAGNCGTPG